MSGSIAAAVRPANLPEPLGKSLPTQGSPQRLSREPHGVHGDGGGSAVLGLFWGYQQPDPAPWGQGEAPARGALGRDAGAASLLIWAAPSWFPARSLRGDRGELGDGEEVPQRGQTAERAPSHPPRRGTLARGPSQEHGAAAALAKARSGLTGSRSRGSGRLWPGSELPKLGYERPPRAWGAGGIRGAGGDVGGEMREARGRAGPAHVPMYPHHHPQLPEPGRASPPSEWDGNGLALARRGRGGRRGPDPVGADDV